MTTIMVTESTKRELSKLMDKDSIKTLDDAVNALLDASQTYDCDDSKTNIYLHQNTFDRLYEYKSRANEPHNDTLFRLLELYFQKK